MLSHYAGAPQYGMEYRSYYMSREWVKSGHKVMIAGASFSHLRKQQPPVGRENIDGIEYVWLKTRSYEGNGVARVLTMVEFVKECYSNKKLFIDFKPDVVIASSVYTFDIYPAHYIAKKCGAKLIYEVHDLWPLSPMVIGGYSKYHPFIWLLQRGENYAYRHVDMVVSMLWNSFSHMRNHGLDAKRFACVPNGYCPDDWTKEYREKQLPDIFQRKLEAVGDKIVIGFIGGFAPSGALGNLIETAAIMKNDQRLHFVLVGAGVEGKKLENLIEQFGLTNVSILPPIAKCLVPSMVAKFDVGYYGGVRSSLHQYGTSANKMTDYMLSAIPIVQAIDEPGSIVEKTGCGLRVDAENPKLCADAIAKLANMSRDERKAMGMRGYKYATENLQWKSLADRFIKILS